MKTNEQELNQTLKEMSRNARAWCPKIGQLAKALGMRSDDLSRSQELSAEEIMATGLATHAEAEAIVFILAETGKDLDYVDHFLCHGW